MHRRSLAVLMVSMAACCLPAAAADAPRCKLAQVAEWPVRMPFNQPVVDGFIDGKKAGILLDTGAAISLITKSSAQKLGIGTWMTGQRVMGFGGDSRIELATIGELRIGDAARKNLRVRVAGEHPIGGVDFILGQDFFKLVDLELDYSERTARLFQPVDCGDAPLAYWDRNALQLPMQDVDHVLVPVTVNGREATAMIDSGAAASLVIRQFAEKLGITPNTPGVVPASCSSGLGADVVKNWIAHFDTVSLGGETIRDARLRITDFPDEWAYSRERFDMVLGTDFLRAHRVYISRYQHKVYFSYTGGQAFTATPGMDCDERLRDKTVDEMRAALDKAIADNPKDVRALVNRAQLRMRDDAQGALADLDAALKLEPTHAVALRTRSEARAKLKDFDGALADSDAAIASGMRNAGMYDSRGYIRMGQGDWNRAIDEFGEALKLDPHDEFALRNQGRLYYNLGRFEPADGNFVTVLALRPNGYDSLWLYFSRARRGNDDRAVLEQAVAKLDNGAWPVPIVQHLLGKIDRDALMAAAALDEKERKGRECEARFYVAQRLVVEGRSDAARSLLQQARDDCPSGFVERDGAAMQLAKGG
jgi:predicted aspartyl protease/tetratricopeptide (TPR) repeat protein